MKFALAGNPNCGKTTLFNALTGSTAHVGNWPGVTVDKREGVYKKLQEKVQIVDLPGIYSLSPYTPEEVVSRNFILDEKPECVINVVDATNLERNLYLTTQLAEIDVPIVIALNMMDAVRANGDSIRVEDIQKTFGVPVVEISALKSNGLDELMKVAYAAAKRPRVGTTVMAEAACAPVVERVRKAFEAKGLISPLFHAVKLLEGDEIEVAAHPEEKAIADELKAALPPDDFDGDYEAIVADQRYKYISEHFSATVTKAKKDEKMTRSDKIDKVLTHRIWGIPLFLVAMFVIFHLVFSEDLLYLNAISGGAIGIGSEGAVNFFTGMGYADLLEEAGGVAEDVCIGIPSPGVFLQSWMGFATGSLIDGVQYLFDLGGEAVGGSWYAGLVCDGLLTGLDAIFSFLPQILLLFLFIAILEDCGYMARVAFIMDRAFRRFGLSGKAFIPLLMGFGCSVPAMMGAKTLEDERERDTTIRLTPFFSCGAKAPIWALLATVVTGSFLGDIFVFSIYLLGIVVAIVAALIMKVFSRNADVPPFIMELPAYHAPQARNLGAHLWDKFKHFVFKAATIITASTIVVWFLRSFPWAFWTGMLGEEEIEQSILGSLGHGLKYFFYPCGWAIGEEGWKYTVAAITGLIAKEDVVATLAVLGLEEGAVGWTLTNAGVYAFAAYNLFTFPCFAAIATAKSESSKKGFLVTMAWWFFGSYVISALIFWIGRLFEVLLPVGIIVVLLLIAAVVAMGIYLSKKRSGATRPNGEKSA